MVEVSRLFVSAETAGLGRAGAGGRPCQGVYYHVPGAPPGPAVIATHYEVDFSEHYLAELLAARGCSFLGWNTRYRGNGEFFRLAGALDDIAVGVRWLRQAGATQVVLLGNSGGASLMSAYQSRASEPDDACDADGAGPGDLFVALCAHPGRPDVLTTWLDPAVTDELDPLSVDPDLDMYNPSNGPPYSPGFVARYRAAQVARNDRITRAAHAELQRLAAAGASDRIMAVPRTWADLRFTDLSLDPSAREAGCYAGDPRRANYGAAGLASACSLRTWLDMWSLSDSSCRGTRHLPRITVPALVAQSTGDQGCFLSDAHTIYDQLGSADKSIELVPGDHYLRTPSEARDQMADLLAEWIAGHPG
jgi:pimeloyl-ACP methyl ester carboxylesterase